MNVKTLFILMNQLGLVEKMGTGIKLMLESCEKAKICPPQFYEDGDFVKVVFFFQPARKKEQDDIDSLLDLFKIQSEVSIHEVMRYLRVSRNTAIRKVNQLIEQKKLLRIGKGPSVRYIERNR